MGKFIPLDDSVLFALEHPILNKIILFFEFAVNNFEVLLSWGIIFGFLALLIVLAFSFGNKKIVAECKLYGIILIVGIILRLLFDFTFNVLFPMVENIKF